MIQIAEKQEKENLIVTVNEKKKKSRAKNQS
jgi:hypothetical protein